MFVDNRLDARRFFLDVWQKYEKKHPMEPMEALILEVILAHPEYHELLQKGDDVLHEEYTPEQGRINPFLHMGMHIAIKEQVQTDRPAGIRNLCDTLLQQKGDQHEMEHCVMECLGEALWQAQRNNTMPDDEAYLESIKALK